MPTRAAIAMKISNEDRVGSKITGSFMGNGMEENINKLRKLYRGRFVSPGPMNLLWPEDALPCIRNGRDLGLELTGIDGFHRSEEGGIQPDQLFDTEMYDDGDKEDFFRQNEDLIRSCIGQSIVFEIVFSEGVL